MRSARDAARSARAEAEHPPQTVYFGRATHEVPVLPAEAIEPETPHAGPAMVSLPGGTILVPPDVGFRVDAYGNTHLDIF
jgi:N-methylhydantoinase A/oxoprolinase/acetone carboxylase beta subunit